MHKTIKTMMILILMSVVLRAGMAPVRVASPDGSIVVSLAVREKSAPYPQGTRLYYSITRNEKVVLMDSPFALSFKHMEPLDRGLAIRNTALREIRETWERVWGKRRQVANHCNELTVDLQETDAPGRKMRCIIRAYDDGVALRYAFPEDAGFTDFKLAAERTEFHFASNHRVWAANYFGQQTTSPIEHIEKALVTYHPKNWPAAHSGFFSHQEAEYNEMFLKQLSPKETYGCPILVEVAADLYVALTEAALTDWAGAYFTHAGNNRYALTTVLSPHVDEPDVAVTSRTPRQSPWRLIMIGETPGDLIESDIIQNLNAPCAIADPSWITPGISAWDRWWCGNYLPDAEFEIGMNDATMKYFIDFAAEMGWEYQLVDWTWYGAPFIGDSWISDPNRDITKSIPEVDIPGLVQYANKKGVKLLIWLEWEQCERQMEEAFPLYEKWGVSGVKIDFMQRDDQWMVNWYHKVVKLAAKHHLIVNFHGAYKPTGWSRTYPNLVTREGVLGNEYNKWSGRITPDHCLTIPFTRGILGHMDFTPGGFRHKAKGLFTHGDGDNPGPFVMGTRCFQLAMMIVYESPLQVMCDSPFSYRISPAGLDFLKRVPTTWDDSHCLAGDIGDYIIMARRSGDAWYLACMTDWDERELEIPLDFLGKGKYNVEIWRDSYDANDYPEHLLKDKQTVTSEDKLTARLASGGGYVAVISPK